MMETSSTGEIGMRFTKKRPTKVGTQFIAVWEFNEVVWSETYIIPFEGGLSVYNDEADRFIRVEEEFLGWADRQFPVKFVIME